MTRAAAVVAALLLAMLVEVGAAPAQPLESAVAEALRVDWQRVSERPGIEGYVYNDSPYRIGVVQLRVMGRDESADAPTPSLAWVYGNIPARGRTYFRVRLPPRRDVVGVTIESFRLIARDLPSESP